MHLNMSSIFRRILADQEDMKVSRFSLVVKPIRTYYMKNILLLLMPVQNFKKRLCTGFVQS